MTGIPAQTAPLPPEIAAHAMAAGRRILPHNLEAEESVVGGILFDGKTLAQVAEILLPQDFYHPALQAIYEAMLALDTQSQPIDILTVARQMHQAGTIGKLRAYEGEAYLAGLANKIATVENIAYHADIVVEAATRRRLIHLGGEMVGRGYGPEEAESQLDRAETGLLDIALRNQREPVSSARQVLNKVIRIVEARYKRKEAITGVPSGFWQFDEKTAGFQPGDLIIVAARPSMGKTALGMACAQNAALDHQIPVLVFSREMSKESLMERLLCSEARVDSTRLRSGFLETRDWINVTKAASRISEAPMWIDEAASTLSQIRAKARRWRSDRTIFPDRLGAALGLLVVDYLQLLVSEPGGKKREANRTEEVSGFSRGLKALAKELGLPVMALSQLNRSVESRADKRPLASDLRESGAIEQDADLICFIYRDEVYNKESPDKGIAEVIINKQRNGPTGLVRLAFLSQYTRFENLSLRSDNA